MILRGKIYEKGSEGLDQDRRDIFLWSFGDVLFFYANSVSYTDFLFH